MTDAKNAPPRKWLLLSSNDGASRTIVEGPALSDYTEISVIERSAFEALERELSAAKARILELESGQIACESKNADQIASYQAEIKRLQKVHNETVCAGADKVGALTYTLLERDAEIKRLEKMLGEPGEGNRYRLALQEIESRDQIIEKLVGALKEISLLFVWEDDHPAYLITSANAVEMAQKALAEVSRLRAPSSKETP